MRQRGRELKSWEELVEKAIDVEANGSLQPPSMLRETDPHYPQVNRPSHTTMAQSQTVATWDLRDKPSTFSERNHAPDPKPSYSSRPDPVDETPNKKNRKEKKKQRRHEHNRALKEFGSAPNTARTSGSALIPCFNCDQQGHYATKCHEPRRERGNSSDSTAG